MSWRFSKADIPFLSLGAAVLGTGGGGDPYIGSLCLRRMMEQGREPEILEIAELTDNMNVIVIGAIGSPAVTLEKLQSDFAPGRIIESVEARSGARIDAIVPLEIGGMNSLLPLMCACACGLPVVDGDGMGRAFPTNERTSFHLAGIPISPVTMIDDHGGVVQLTYADETRIEAAIRAVVLTFGGRAVSALYPMTGRQAREATLAGTMSLATQLGRAMLDARRDDGDVFAAIFRTLAAANRPGRVIFDGKVVALERRQRGGWNVGEGKLQGLGEYRGASVEFKFQNEFLVVRREGRPLITVPDLIAFLDRETADPITCEKLRFGQRIKVLGITGDDVFTSEAGLRLTNPASFGLEDGYASGAIQGAAQPAAASLPPAVEAIQEIN